MKIRHFTFFVATVWMGAATVVAPVAAQPTTPIAVEAFFKKPAVRSPALSPSGKQIAMLVPTSTGRVGIAVANVETPDKFTGIAQFDDSDVRTFAWVNDKRLVFDAFDQQATLGDQLGNGLYAVNADGTDFVWLIERTGNYRTVGNPVIRPLPSNRNLYVRPLYDGSDDVLIQHWLPVVGLNMMRLNTRTIATKNIYNGDVPKEARQWVIDQNLQPRAVIAEDGKDKLALHWRSEGSTRWEKLNSWDMFDEMGSALTPEGIDGTGQMYVSAIKKDSTDRTTALYRYDIQKHQMEDAPLVSIPGFDFQGRLVFGTVNKKLLGVKYDMDAPGVVWFDKTLDEIQKKVDTLLPNTVNDISCPGCVSTAHWVVTATSDVQSPIYFLFETATQKLKLLGATRPWLDSRQMAGTQDFLRIKARDGMEIPVYVTKPKGKGPWPTVIMVHGGPYLRGVQWMFNPVNQFLASRGYLVVEPEFRGSMGYGDKLFKAGWKQWGLAMQDDITDVTRWAIASSGADAKRIAIAGASYGGYATMMGLLKEPELYKVGVNWVGVTDIELLYSINWGDFNRQDGPWIKYGMPKMIGDRDKDAAQFKATSPLQNAGRIKQPVLMAYGEEDYRVPLPHGTKMRDALLASGNRNVEWIQYEGEGHGFMLVKNNVDFWTRVENFLAKNLK
jgi:dienelactone hydrolase